MRYGLLVVLGLTLSTSALAADPFQSNSGPSTGPAPTPRRSVPRPAPEPAMPPASAAPAPAAANRYDGRWAVALTCPQASDGALSFGWNFTADVRNGQLHGQYRTPGEAPSMALDGPIRPDGSAQFQARGLTGVSAYNVTQVARGIPFTHDVTARFDTARGTGSWTAGRTCNLAFVKQ